MRWDILILNIQLTITRSSVKDLLQDLFTEIKG